jgi:hypothetical protein
VLPIKLAIISAVILGCSRCGTCPQSSGEQKKTKTKTKRVENLFKERVKWDN